LSPINTNYNAPESFVITRNAIYYGTKELKVLVTVLRRFVSYCYKITLLLAETHLKVGKFYMELLNVTKHFVCSRN